MKRVKEQMAIHDVAIELTDEAKELLVDKGYDLAMGARPLRRAIQRNRGSARRLRARRIVEPGSTILVSRKGETDEVDMTVIPGEVTPEDVVTVPPEEPGFRRDDRLRRRIVFALGPAGSADQDAVTAWRRRSWNHGRHPVPGRDPRFARRGRTQAQAADGSKPLFSFQLWQLGLALVLPLVCAAATFRRSQKS